ncbi:vasotocin-neurophysin VT 2 [Oncorhynchus keta]|uniref:vasotocin-neurophysin VT 2 n=1 Tax=Oncorhynchus keta TaxID=8018 RepID=UPI0015FE0E4C|nr:vasotocin-neurophysin VT 2 [Oncorhynchus keta]
MPHSTLLLCVIGLLAFSSACYIQNCPRGGKRALQDIGIRQCMTCGPGDQGHCFGPSICCGEGLGCWMGSPETARCFEENYLPTPCQTGGRPCGSDAGRCAAPGVCCDSESCVLDPDCLSESRYHSPADHSAGATSDSPGELLLRLLHFATRGQSEYKQ